MTHGDGNPKHPVARPTNYRPEIVQKIADAMALLATLPRPDWQHLRGG